MFNFSQFMPGALAGSNPAVQGNNPAVMPPQQGILGASSPQPYGMPGAPSPWTGASSPAVQPPSPPISYQPPTPTPQMAPPPAPMAVQTPRMPAASSMGGSGMPFAREDGGLIPNRADGGFNMAKSPHMGAGWQVRNEARQNVHTGPIFSAVPGRTDHHSTNVPSGSYVVPADVVSGRGQGNTIAGSKAIMSMFKMGPYGTSVPHLGHGAGIPRGPRLAKAADGGAQGDNIGQPTPVNLAGGEIVIPPENIMDVVHPDLDTAHQILDSWVLNERKNHIKTLKKLPGPAKD